MLVDSIRTVIGIMDDREDRSMKIRHESDLDQAVKVRTSYLFQYYNSVIPSGCNLLDGSPELSDPRGNS